MRPQIIINGNIMGTVYSVKVSGHIPVKKACLQQKINAVLEQVNNDISTYNANYFLFHFNHSNNTHPQLISRGLANIIIMAQRIGHDTSGAMDITIGSLVNLWGFGPDKKPVKIPTEQQIVEAQKKVGLQYLNLFSNHRGEWLQKTLPNIYVDLSTLGEGYCTDELAKLMMRNGITNYLVSVGGAISTHGLNGHGKPWRVAIQQPIDYKNAVQALVDLHGYSISTAGSYRNYFEKDGLHYSHVIDPSIGKPIQHHLVSATVIASSALEADGWDTGLMVLDTEKALKLAQEKELAAYLISATNNGFSTVMTTQFKAFMVQ